MPGAYNPKYFNTKQEVADGLAELPGGKGYSDIVFGAKLEYSREKVAKQWAALLAAGPLPTSIHGLMNKAVM